ncbi:MAG: D-glycerate dehydrogenase [Desulfosarcinaceae bacterium]|nr:D-glycerate dehydrogenase [Desulfosarcinaceae bacterium]
MRIVVSGRLPDVVRERLEAQHEVILNLHDAPMARADLLDQVANSDGLLCMITDRVDAELLDRAPNLKMVANCGVGYDNIDVADCSRRGILVSNTPGVLTEATAELTWALILAISRNVVSGDAYTRAGRFRFWAPLHFLGTEVSGKTLGIIGMGRIGRAVARRAAGFQMPVCYYSRSPLPEDAAAGFEGEAVSFDALLERADFVTLHLPLTRETQHLIDAAALARMKSNAFLINTARGPVVDETALVGALRSGQIAGAALDVYENEPALAPGLAELDNVVLLPHMGSATWETRTRMTALAAENLLAGLAGRQPPNCLNWPSSRSADT